MYQGARTRVAAWLQAVPVQVAEQPVATAEQEEEQVPPTQKVLHALAVRVPHELEDEDEENEVVCEGLSLVGSLWPLDPDGLLVGFSVGFPVGFGGTLGGLGVGMPSGPITIGGRLGG